MLVACLVVTVLIACVISERKKRKSHFSLNRPNVAVAVTCITNDQTTAISMKEGVASGTGDSVDCRDNQSYTTALNDDSDLNEENKANASVMDYSVDCRDNPSYVTTLKDNSDLSVANAAYGLSLATVAVTCITDDQTTAISMKEGVASGTGDSVDCRDNQSYTTALNDDSDLNEENKATAAYGLSLDEHQYEYADHGASK